MESNKVFNYIENLPKGLNPILKEIEKINIGKLSYSVQELQSMDVFSDEKEENRRILKETEEYLSLCDDFLGEKKSSNTRIRELFNNSIEKREIGENIDINLSDMKSKIFTLADLSFKANKLTKLLCERSTEMIIGKNMHNNGNLGLKKVIEGLEGIYRNSNSETGKRISVKDQLSTLNGNLGLADYEGWRENFDLKLSDEDALKSLFDDLCPIWHVRDVLYEIKSQLNTELIRCLIADNYTEFTNWGFVKDGNMWVLNFDPKQVTERYGYHIPSEGKVLSEDVIKQLNKQNLLFKLDFTSIIKKNSLDRIRDITGKDGKEFLSGYKTRLITLLKSVDLENYTEDEYDKINELYTLGKLMSVGTYGRLVSEHPELEKQCQLLKKMVYPSKESKKSLSNINVDKGYQTEYEKYIMEQIEEILKRTKTIYIQKGNNLDKQASKYALRKHMKDKFGIDVQVVEIDAGEEIEGDGLFADAGKLEGIEGYGPNYAGKKRRVKINANVSRAQKSTCGVLSQYGFYVPNKIVQYADGITDERILLPRYGLNVSRYLIGKKLFDFAEAQREDGTYLIESELTDDELKEYSTIPKKTTKNNKGTDLKELCDRRKEEIDRDTKEIAKNIYAIHTEKGDKYVAVVDHIINCGAMISYSLGCDYYVSVATKRANFTKSSDDYYEENKATFTVNANPNKGNGTLPKELLRWCEDLRDNGENDVLKMITIPRKKDEDVKRISDEKPFVKDTEDMVVFGGPKTPHLYVTVKDNDLDIKKVITDEITARLGAKEIENDDRIKLIKNSSAAWKNTSAKAIAEEILADTELTLTDVERQGAIINSIIKEKGRDEHDITSN